MCLNLWYEIYIWYIKNIKVKNKAIYKKKPVKERILLLSIIIKLIPPRTLIIRIKGFNWKSKISWGNDLVFKPLWAPIKKRTNKFCLFFFKKVLNCSALLLRKIANLAVLSEGSFGAPHPTPVRGRDKEKKAFLFLGFNLLLLLKKLQKAKVICNKLFNI